MKPIYLIFGLLFFIGCKKKETLSLAPAIEFVSISPSVVQQFQDSIVFNISYNDEDGDIGENNASVNNVFITDNRINIVYPFRVKQLAPSDAKIKIKGNLEFILKNTEITDSSTSQSASYTIYLVDRAGNKSNSVVTPEITVKK